MIDAAYASAMARYNRWMNERLYALCAELPDEERRRDRGAFFGSIHATLCHLLWADRMWLSRFRGTAAPAGGIAGSTSLYDDWADLDEARAAFDVELQAWADGVDQPWLDGELGWHSGATGRHLTKPTALLVVHLFNHQAHHRGQIHAMLTAAGAKPEATDLPLMPVGSSGSR